MNEIKVGDIYVASWGFDQTNVDAYQCVARTPKMATFRPIATEKVENSEGAMCQHCVPVKDAFLPVSSFNASFNVRASLVDGFNVQGKKWRHALKHVAGKTYYESWYH